MRRQWLAFFTLVALATTAKAELKELTIYRREAFAEGMEFDNTGPYEKLVGVARFAVDPKHPRNAAIVDLSLAPRNAAGLVEFETDVYILAPKDPAHGN